MREQARVESSARVMDKVPCLANWLLRMCLVRCCCQRAVPWWMATVAWVHIKKLYCWHGLGNWWSQVWHCDCSCWWLGCTHWWWQCNAVDRLGHDPGKAMACLQTTWQTVHVSIANSPCWVLIQAFILLSTALRLSMQILRLPMWWAKLWRSARVSDLRYWSTRSNFE